MEKGMLSYNVKKYNEAIGIFTDAIKIDSTNWEIYWKRGSAYYVLGNFDKAIIDYNKCQSLSDSINLRIYLQRATAFQASGKVKEAEKDINHFIDLQPNLPDGYTALGNFYIQIGDIDKSAKNIKRALEIDPGYPEALLLMGAILESKGAIDEACKYYNSALENGIVEAQVFIDRSCNQL